MLRQGWNIKKAVFSSSCNSVLNHNLGLLPASIKEAVAVATEDSVLGGSNESRLSLVLTAVGFTDLELFIFSFAAKN